MKATILLKKLLKSNWFDGKNFDFGKREFRVFPHSHSALWFENFSPTIFSHKFRQSNFFTIYKVNWFHESFWNGGKFTKTAHCDCAIKRVYVLFCANFCNELSLFSQKIVPFQVSVKFFVFHTVSSYIFADLLRVTKNCITSYLLNKSIYSISSFLKLGNCKNES